MKTLPYLLRLVKVRFVCSCQTIGDILRNMKLLAHLPFESLLSHLSTLHGAFPTKMPYALKPGQLPPARHTDENIRGGVYFYGSLHACLLHDFATFGDNHLIRLR